jgi:cytochrome c oxidase assembly factor CtaG/putative copper export protein
VGRVWLAVVIIAAAVTSLTFMARLSPAVALTGLLAAVGSVPLRLMGPAAAGENVNAGIDAVLLHVFGAGVWVGGTLVLALISGPLAAASGDRGGLMVTVLHRFSILAGSGLVLVLGSGVLSAVLRLDGWNGLLSPYGVLLVVKAAAVMLLGGAGFLYRRQLVGRLCRGTGGRGALWRMTGAELLVLGAVSGISGAVGRVSALAQQEPRPETAAARLPTGYEMPPPLEAASWLTQWRVDWTWAVFAVLAAGLYLAGVRRLADRGTAWPVHRTVCWLAALAVLLYITCGVPAIYGPVLFSVHAGAHLALAFIVSLLLVAATPLVLLSETVSPRTDGSLGAAEIASAVRRVRRRWLPHPALSAVLLVGSFIGFYYSPAFRQVLQGHVAHEVVEGFFILIGICYYQSVLQPGRTPRRMDTGAQTAAVTAGMFCLWTAWLVFSTEPIAADWFTSLGSDWGPGPLTDQHNTALVVWLIAALPSFLTAAWVAVRGGLSPRRLDRSSG